MQRAVDLRLEIERNADGSVSLVGKLDRSTLPVFDEAVSGSLSTLVLDLSGLTLIDSAALGHLLRIATTERRDLRLIAPQDAVRHAIEIVRLHLVPGVVLED
jgi:anti-anti-sigma factor